MHNIVTKKNQRSRVFDKDEPENSKRDAKGRHSEGHKGLKNRNNMQKT